MKEGEYSFSDPHGRSNIPASFDANRISKVSKRQRSEETEASREQQKPPLRKPNKDLISNGLTFSVTNTDAVAIVPEGYRAQVE